MAKKSDSKSKKCGAAAPAVRAVDATSTHETRQVDDPPPKAPEDAEWVDDDDASPGRGHETWEGPAPEDQDGAVTARRVGTPSGVATAASMNAPVHAPPPAIAAVEAALMSQAIAIVGRSSLPVRSR